jgi:hypothetical protein
VTAVIHSVGRGAVPPAFHLSINETLDIGEDTGTPVSEDDHVPFTFTGDLNRVLTRLSDAPPSAEAA